MDSPIRLTGAAVRARIAQLILHDDDDSVEFGTIILRPHQVEAVSRLRLSIDEFGGALLCDDVGMGKTFVATAIAQRFSTVLVVTPAALRGMWSEALRRSDIEGTLCTFERLSRGRISGRYDFVIVDEAHHVRNSKTRRYRSLSAVVQSAKVLLLSATPIHNREADLQNLLGLFLGSRSSMLTQSELSRCVVRRVDARLRGEAGIPVVVKPVRIEVGDRHVVVRDLLALPPPVPLRDGGEARTLIARGLIHQWASSDAALHAAIRRRRSRAYALLASLQSGTLPTASELTTWVFDDDALQLGFAELLAEPVADAQSLLLHLNAHLAALERLSREHSSDFSLDEERANAVVEITRRHPTSRIIAFAQYEETVRAMFRRLMNHTRAALLTAGGAQIASGRMRREEVLQQFGVNCVEVPAAERIDLLLTTDILSEGVNLQNADVVIHLDTPWTAARLEQRVGRVARMGSTHTVVSVYVLNAPPSAGEFLEIEGIVNRKWRTARAAIGTTSPQPFLTDGTAEVTPVPELTESLRAVLRTWRCDDFAHPPATLSQPCITAVKADRRGFLAALCHDNRVILLCGCERTVSTALDSLLETAQGCIGADIPANQDSVDEALARIKAWVESQRSRDMMGIADASTVVRRPRISARIESIIASSPLHLRVNRSMKAQRAHEAASRQQSASIESFFNEMRDAELSDDDWLERLSDQKLLSMPGPTRSVAERATLCALILLEPK